eukprot:4478732-Pleurochrysis_carterae.AAC.1
MLTRHRLQHLHHCQRREQSDRQQCLDPVNKPRRSTTRNKRCELFISVPTGHVFTVATEALAHMLPASSRSPCFLSPSPILILTTVLLDTP